jgi:phosphoribosylglycinamide formyltransferase-1
MGVTVHFVDEGVDTGPILLQEAFRVDPYALGLEEIESKVHAIEHELLPRAIRLIAAGDVRVDPAAPRRVIVTDPATDGGDKSGDE